jgi:hypothetical protein
MFAIFFITDLNLFNIYFCVMARKANLAQDIETVGNLSQDWESKQLTKQ